MNKTIEYALLFAAFAFAMAPFSLQGQNDEAESYEQAQLLVSKRSPIRLSHV